MISFENRLVVTADNETDCVSFVVGGSTAFVEAHIAYAYYMVRAGYKVEAIKHIREAFNCGLKEAKVFVESSTESFNGGTFNCS